MKHMEDMRVVAYVDLLIVCSKEKDALGGDILLGRLSQLRWRFGYLQEKHIFIRALYYKQCMVE